MARKKFLCDSCGLYNKSRKEYEMCMPCRLKVNRENRDINICSCGNTMYKESKVCWQCIVKNKKNKAGTVCPQCNISIIKNQDANICINCYREKMKARSGENHPLYRFDKKKCKNCGETVRDTNELCKVCYEKNRAAPERYCVQCNSKLTYRSSAVLAKSKGFCLKCFVGENHFSWNKNKTQEERITERKESEYRVWRKDVYSANNYTCQKCGDNKGGNLNAHHIFNYSKYRESRFDLDNGITLCVSCHKDFHKKYGNKNNDLNQLLHFLNTNTSNVGIFTNN